MFIVRLFINVEWLITVWSYDSQTLPYVGLHAYAISWNTSVIIYCKNTVHFDLQYLFQASLGEFCHSHKIFSAKRSEIQLGMFTVHYNAGMNSGYAVVHGRPKTPKNTIFWESPSPQGSHSTYVLGDTTRPGHVTHVLVWSKSDQRRLRKTLHKQTNKQTDKPTDTTRIMVTSPWTKNTSAVECIYNISVTVFFHFSKNQLNARLRGRISRS